MNVENGGMKNIKEIKMRIIDADALLKTIQDLEQASGESAESFVNSAGNRSIEFDRLEDYINNAKTINTIEVERRVRLHIEPTKLQVGDVMKFPNGNWKVLDVAGDKALIWKCTNVKDHVFNENNSNVYEGSDIQRYLQEDFSETMPVNIMEDVTKEGFFLLTVEQIRKYMPKELDRIATDEDDRTTWYWTAGPRVGIGSNVRSIGPAGYVCHDSAITSYGVAPACWISIRRS